MIYELAVVVRPTSGDDTLASLKTLVAEAITEKGGEVLLADDWGMLHLAQPTSKGIGQGKFLFFIYSSDNSTTNTELARRFRINEEVINVRSKLYGVLRVACTVVLKPNH